MVRGFFSDRLGRAAPRVLACGVALALSLAALAPSRPGLAQEPPQPTDAVSEQVRSLIANMSVQQRVGQLFIISFPGNDTSARSDIADLIQNYRVGGVRLAAGNENFSNLDGSAPAPQQVTDLTNALQRLAMPPASAARVPGEIFVAPSARVALTTTLTQSVTPTLAITSGVSIPLFVAMTHQADWVTRLELNEITNSLTQIPSQLALGATWNPANAQTTGEILGRELSLLGVNVLLGPTLDVVDLPRPNTPSDLGTLTFGGDPFWVGKMGSAFVLGVHRGSGNRMAVVARNFPGLGSSDRNVNDEIPTVQKSLEQLKQIELAPFFAVTKGDVAQEGTADGLLVSHIRYRGFQGNIRASTRPVSLDPQAYQALMSLPELAQWRASGGVTFSDALGVRSVSRFYDPLETSFNARRIAQDAFAAGNDVLVLGNFGLSASWPEQLANIKDALRYFQTRYIEDASFAARVDESLARVLSLKLRMYGGSFDRSQTQSAGITAAEQPQLQQHASALPAIAQEGITLLSPLARDLPSVLPNAPTRDESIVFISDDRVVRECVQCATYPAVPPRALADTAVRLYGPSGTGQIDPTKVSSFTFADLTDFNARASAPITATAAPASTAVPSPGLLLPATPPGEPPEPTPQPATEPLQIETAIQQASWVVIAMLDASPTATSTQALRTFLAQSATTLKDKRVIVFALAAPYYLDATEISKVTAYYGVYSRTPVYLETAMRALFGEFVPPGSSPVSVPGLGYSLIVQTAPDPNQVIPLIPVTAGEAITDTQATPAPLTLKIGDRLKLRAGPIYDKNGRIVPDGTQVQFILSYPAERVEQREPPVSTRDGVADTTLLLERQGKLQIRAESDPAMNSYVVVVDTTNVVSIETIRPTALPTETPAATSAAPEQFTPMPAPPIDAQPPEPPNRTSFAGFILALLGLLVTGFGLWFVLSRRWPGAFQARTRLRAALGVWIVGWLAYVLAAIGSPGTRWASNGMGWAGSGMLALVVALMAAAAVMALAQRRASVTRHAPS